MKVKRNYLTALELETIVSEMLLKDNDIERYILKISLIAQILCDGEDFSEYNDCESIYDKVVSTKLEDSSLLEFFENKLVNYDIIDKTVKSELSIDKSVKTFLTNLDNKVNNVIDKLPKNFSDIDLSNLDLTKQLEQFKEVINNNETVY